MMILAIEQTIEMFGLAISVADLVVATLTGGGAYGGTKTAALSRMRLEDRRRMRDDVLPGFNSTPTTTVVALRIDATFSKADKIIELLGWTERSIYVDLCNTINRAELSRLRALSDPSVPVEMRNEVEAQKALGIVASLDRTAFLRKATDLENYVEMHLRATTVRRWLRLRVTAEQLLTGPWRV